MILDPIIPIWIMAIISIGTLIFLFRKNGIQKNLSAILLLFLLFISNLRIRIKSDNLVPSNNNLDVLFVIDKTISMNAEDGYQNKTRLENAKSTCYKIIEELSGARFSVITFANTSSILTPFVKDASLAKDSIDTIKVMEELYAQGSSLNTPIEVTQNVLKSATKKEGRKRIIFFISDGEITNKSKLESFASLQQYIDGGAVLGYGTEQGGKMKAWNSFEEGEEYLKYYDENYRYVDAISVIDEQNLSQIASDLKIPYIHVESDSSVDKTIEQIKKQATSNLSEEEKKGYDDIYFLFMIPMAILLILEFKKI